MYHYVYRLDHLETNEFYIGSRTSKVHPSLDPYMGSMSTWKPDKTKLKKTILKDDFLDRESAILFEADEISKFIDEDLNRNYYVPNKGFHTIGHTTVKDLDGKTLSISINDSRIISGELKSVTCGNVVVKDEFGNNFYVKKDDPRIKCGELVNINTGQVNVKDKEGNISRVSVNDPRYLSGELVSIFKGKVTVKDKEGNKLSVSLDDPRYLSGELVPIWNGKKHSNETIENVKKTFKRIGHQQGEKNSSWGTCWIYKGDENKKIRKEELNNYISLGWLKGRICKDKKDKKYMHKDNKIITVSINDTSKYLKLGWFYGRK